MVFYFSWLSFGDISSRKANDAAFRRSESRLRSLFEFSPDAFAVTHSHRSIEEVNAKTENLFGYSRGELLASPSKSLSPSVSLNPIPSVS